MVQPNYIKYYTKYSKVLLTKAAFNRHNPKAGVASKTKEKAFLKFYIQEEDSISLIYF
jgi:hypothetical protein